MTDFENLFTQRSAQAGSPQARGAKDEDWADVTLRSRNRGQASAMAATTMPSLDELPRPEILFASQIPYHLIVKVVHDGMVVQGSHQGSLELLARYLQKHTRNVENISIKVSQALCIRLLFHHSFPLSTSPKPHAHSGTASDFQVRASGLAFRLRRTVRFDCHHAGRLS